MKKTVMNLAIASCFAFGISAAQAYNPGLYGDPAVSAEYTKKATVTGQTQNVKVDAKGVRLPYNMAQDLPSVSESQHGVRPGYGAANTFHTVLNVAKPRVEPKEYHCMHAAYGPSGSCFNKYPTSSGNNFYTAR